MLKNSHTRFHLLRLCRNLTLVALALLTLLACSTHKNTAKNRWWQSFNARYNTYYNGHQAYIDGSLEKEKGIKDNYTEILPMNMVGNKQSRETGKGNFDRAIEKSEKTIKQHSIKGKPEWNKSRRKTEKDKEWLSRSEYNPFLWKAWLLLGKAQFQKGAFDEAAATFSYMSRLYQTQPAINGIARAWLAQSYIEQDWLYDAEDVIRNTQRDSIHYRAQKDWNMALANYYLRNKDYERAVPCLSQAIKNERRKTQKARLWFLMGQIETQLGHRDNAYRAYRKVVSQNPPYELEFNARIAQTEVMAKGNGKKMISKLKRMARSDKNKDYLDQVYYAIGNIYLMQKDTANAIGAYEQGAEEATRSGIEKGVLLLKLGDIYWVKEKYNDAQRCYGEAIGLLDKDRPDYEELSKRSKVLDELVPHTDAVYLQDSLQLLAKMPEKERLEAIDRVIDALKKKEKEEADRARAAEVEEALQKQSAQNPRQQRNTPTAPVAQTGNKNAQWYFYNPTAVNQGKQQFQRQWGKRENIDNWQRANQTVVNLNEPDTSENPDTPEENPDNPEKPDSQESPDTTENTERPGATDHPDQPLADADLAKAASDSVASDTLANDPHNREYYLAQIPFTDEQVEASNQIIMDGLYNSGVIFKDKLENMRLAEKQFNRLTTQYPDFGQMDQAFYHLFLLYSRRGEHSRADSCLTRMKADYPESEWTILLSDPYFAENARFGEHIEDSLYAATYEAFKNDRFDEVDTNAKLSAERFPLGENRPKFLFIDGLSLLNNGDAKGCVDQLTTVVEKYPQSEVTEMAGMIIKGVKEGRQLYGGKFDLNDVWSRRDLTLALDSTSTDTLSAERITEFLFILAYEPDSLAMAFNKTPQQSENQLLFEMARYNFSNFMVRNFDIAIDQENGVRRMTISGFLNYDEALQYARQLRSDQHIGALLQPCRPIIISRHNLSLIGTRYSYRDYDEFYERTFVPLVISNEELLQIPAEGPVTPEEPDDIESEDDPEASDAPGSTTGDPFLDDLF